MKFKSISVRRCTCRAFLYDVVYQDGMKETLHHGLLGQLTEAQRQQIKEARSA